MSKKERILKKILGVTKKVAPDSEIYLYGSRARGDARKFSDWDRLILLNVMSISFDFETKLMDELYEVELEKGRD